MVIIGCDENGIELKTVLKNELSAMNIEFIDYNEKYGTADELYPDIAVGLCKRLISDKLFRGILICIMQTIK